MFMRTAIKILLYTIVEWQEEYKKQKKALFSVNT